MLHNYFLVQFNKNFVQVWTTNFSWIWDIRPQNKLIVENCLANFSFLVAFTVHCCTNFLPTPYGDKRGNKNPEGICHYVVCIVIKWARRKVVTIQHSSYVVQKSPVKLPQWYSKLQYVTVWLFCCYCIPANFPGQQNCWRNRKEENRSIYYTYVLLFYFIFFFFWDKTIHIIHLFKTETSNVNPSMHF